MDLTIASLGGGYGRVQILAGISLELGAGSLVSIVGRNGVGKTTLLQTIAGHLPAMSGTIRLGDGTDISRWPIRRRVRHGLVHVPQDMSLFGGMTVNDNLELGAHLVRDKNVVRQSRELVFDAFPRLAERHRQLAGTMSGGEQRMLAIGRGLMAAPRILLLDEPCTGLSVATQDALFVALRRVLAVGIGIALAEQNLARAVADATHVHVLQRGTIVMGRTNLTSDDRSSLVADISTALGSEGESPVMKRVGSA
jgi:branched-chain amino acid transport system ATP-binding protein